MESLDEYIARLASDQPVPGGGSAAAVTAALGAALVAMVARICAGNPKYAAHESDARAIAAESDAVRSALVEARERDERAFGEVVAAQRLPKATPHEAAIRREALEAALSAAACVPLDAADLALQTLRLALRALAIPNRALAGDAGCAAEFAAAAIAAFAYNVEANHRYMRDETAIGQQCERLRRCRSQSSDLLEHVRRHATLR